jgi:hypothetical protein
MVVVRAAVACVCVCVHIWLQRSCGCVIAGLAYREFMLLEIKGAHGCGCNHRLLLICLHMPACSWLAGGQACVFCALGDEAGRYGRQC